ncbi:MULTISPECIES: IS30 family transposase [Caproicibacterium]|uniref:IS30 family transposase n=1 Tax=Caproicibacterium TaxID=2834348 RepID=UPI003898E9E9
MSHLAPTETSQRDDNERRNRIGNIQTGTTDRGKEFACCTAIQKQLGLTLYFADAYSSWQRGSNENSNGLLREFYPKKTNLALVPQAELTHSLFLINSRPRKCLGWKSSIQVFLHELAHLTLQFS